MLGYFPKPYPDELFYSVLCRLKVHMGIVSSHTFSKYVYGDKSVPTSIGFPVNLQRLLDNLPHGSTLTFNGILNNNSMLNYYLPFIPSEKHDNVLLKIDNKTLETRKLDLYLGALSSKVPFPTYLKFCDDCVSEDTNTFGEPYYHRSHQLPGVSVCHKHKKPLIKSTVTYNSKLREDWLMPLSDNIGTGEKEAVNSEFLEYVAIESHKLVNLTYNNYGISYLRERYITEFIKNNLATFNKHSNHTEIQELLDTKIPKKFMEEFAIDNKDTYWLTHLTGNGNKVSIHPLRLICLNYALGITMDDILNGNIEYKPFGEPPWVCLNPVCTNYKQFVVNDIFIRTNKKDDNPLGVFTCPHCDYTYMRKGPDELKSSIFTKSRTLNYGEIFKERLLHLVDVEEVSFNSLSHNYFDGMDGKSLKMWYLRWKDDSVTANKMNDQIAKNRAFWVEMLKEFPEENRSFFQDKFLSEYRFCSVHDTEWFEKHFPKTSEPVSKTISFGKGNKSRLKDWKKEDLEYSEKLKLAIKEFKSEYPNTKASYAAIEKRIGKYAYCSSHKDKMPISFKILDEFILSTKHFEKFYIQNKKTTSSSS